MRSESVERLRAHARSIVRSAWLEPAVEADVEEEIHGHLIERLRRLSLAA